MSGEKKLVRLIKEMTPVLHEGTYVFCSVKNAHKIPREDTIGEFIEEEGTTIILKKEKADQLDLSYDYIASWITLKIHSSLDMD